MLVFCQCFKQDLCFVDHKVCFCLCCLFLLFLCADQIVFLKARVAAARDWGKPCVCFELFIHPLSAAVGAAGICLTLHCTYQLLDAWPKPTPALWDPWPNLQASLCRGDLAVHHGIPLWLPAQLFTGRGKWESWEHWSRPGSCFPLQISAGFTPVFNRCK